METKKPGVGFGVLLLKDGKVLLGKRHDDPEKADSELEGAGKWTMPGGKLHYQETFEDGAYREVLEETGIEIDRSCLRHISTTNNIVENAHFVTLGYLCETFTGEAEVREPDEIVEWQWFDLDELPEPLYFPSKQVLDGFDALG
ncbi:MAG: MutT/nudix family protein [Candidatus Wolfebacteria bacterium GW2011_GWE1_48_7]|uniref:MutT/nudix family protein n=2 Tax=Candidatus Wolfeibacteriota TaxID=1752735 RepID=A0A0G1U4V9_9BACT|nr:MAG: MutT/nudix family protein, 7,8-dihydro-8-oxoguanine triphosphatase [Candidatus Wolfebacteria bacterium GW2011_GWB1_47_1]KKU42172.1 MAG: MutT/nudix family protein [Candidatus Wolfebacteria bacterium GW2011_GWB2_46_69]KKU54052.1 MAG: MutT/nudix family protein [Candidatus Wolfebacteria bacterium GW2011_GWC1_47_103]KKU59239.1 MAG: MutT/nudix family protein [Candidatus Wolfebacteria bacterium GW2011_GWE2_47_12]KKU65994.1 MAG: MutT/nudix family protein [Candidatus Wolfebacteria bacterium GW20